MILDTTFLIDLIRGNKDAQEKLHQLSTSHELTLITTLSLFELFSGVARSTPAQKEQEKIKTILVGQPLIPLDISSAELGGIIDGTLIKQGTPIGPIDCMIAGIAINRKEKLLTRNTKDFSKINGLQTETY